MASMTSDNRKRYEKKSTEQEEAHFVSRVTVTLTRENERRSTKSTHVKVYLFRDLNRDRSRLPWMTVGPKDRYRPKRRTCKRHSQKRSNVEITSIDDGRLLTCVRWCQLVVAQPGWLKHSNNATCLNLTACLDKRSLFNLTRTETKEAEYE